MSWRDKCNGCNRYNYDCKYCIENKLDEMEKENKQFAKQNIQLKLEYNPVKIDEGIKMALDEEKEQ